VSARAVRLGLLALVLVVGLSVAFTYRRPARSAAPAARASPTLPAAARTENLVFRSFRKDEQSFSLSAREMVGREQEELRLQGVALSFTYTVHGKAQQGTITAEECVYQPAQQKAAFKGKVRLTSAEGFELLTDALVYRGDKGLVRTEDPVRFRRKDVSGTARGIAYSSESGRLEMLAEVVMQMRDPDDPPLDVTAGRAELHREGGHLLLDGGVSMTQGADTLRSRQMLVEFSEGQQVSHIQALDDVDLRTTGAPPSRLAQQLACRKLDLVFRPDRTLAEAVAGQAVLTLPPAAGQVETRILEGRTLAFSFDEQGRMVSARGQQGTTFTVQAPGMAPRALKSQRFMADVEAGTGEITKVAFEKEVEFQQGGRRATSELASYDAKGVFNLQAGPELVDEEQGMRLKAEAIDVATRSGDLEGRRNVRHVVQGRKQGGLLGGSGQPVVVTARSFAYRAAEKQARYQDALLRSGRSEVRAGDLVLREAEGRQRVEAKGSVVSRLHPDKQAGAAGQPVTGSSEEMTYDEARREVVYHGAVTLRQGEVLMRSPHARLALSADAGTVERLEAGEPVEIEQGRRRAQGARGTYAPGDGTLTVEGDKVVLSDEGQVVRGRKVTFHVGDERVLVDGGEQVRTQTVFKKESPP
jgi:LPS export ABC transporter protein LptC/lipopolysaccharide transport protein LptA